MVEQQTSKSKLEVLVGATRLELAEMKGRVQALEKSLADALAKAKEGVARPLMRAPVKQVAKRRSLR